MPQAAQRPFEGREQELASLTERWQLAIEGAGQVVLVSAASGVGKSRLLEVFAERTADEERAVLICRCSQRRRWTAFSPFVDLLQRLEWARRQNPREKPGSGDSPRKPDPRDRLRTTLISRLRALVLPVKPTGAHALHLSPEGRPRKTLEELLSLFAESAKRLPILLIIEDLDWMDPSTLALLEMLVQRRHHVPWMTVLTLTPRLELPWSRRARVTQIELSHLTGSQQERLLDHWLAERPLAPEHRRDLIARADGVPLFLEEQARCIEQLGGNFTIQTKSHAPGENQDSDPRQNPNARQAALPPPLQHGLAARLERLDNAQELAQLASVIGEEMSRAQLAALSPLEPTELDEALNRLVDMAILMRPDHHAELAFRHSMIRETIYASFAEQSRRDAHRRMAEILNSADVEALGHRSGGPISDLERIAHHYHKAGLPMAAASSWHQAAEQAVRSSANLEAAERAQQGLSMLRWIPDGEKRRALEVDLQIVLGAALGTAKGFASADAVAAYDSALELIWQAPRAADHFPALQELASYYLSRGHVHTAHETATRAFEGLGHSDVEILPAAQRTLGFARLLEGDFKGAETALEKSLTPFSVHRSLLSATPPALAIPMTEAFSHLSLAQWFLGRPSWALKQSTDSLALARQSNDPYSRVFAVLRASYLHVFRREPIATRELAHELVELANRHGYLFFIAAGMFLEGQALAAQGRAAEGLQMMSGGLDGVWASGMEVGRPRNLALLAEACGRSELYEQGLSLIKEGVAAAELTGEAHYEAELFRIQGELLRHSGGPEPEIEESFLQALGLARRQGSVSLELRAATSLSRLRQAQGKLRQAKELLAEVHAKFDEGFDTADLKEAEELLHELT